MLLSLIVGALAGWGARVWEPKITDALAGVLGEAFLGRAADRAALSLFAVMLLGALLLWLLDVEASAFVLLLGAALGYFQEQIRARLVGRDG